MNLADVINELVEERDLDKTVLADIVTEAMLAAYKKKYPHLDLRVQLKKDNSALVVESSKEVVQTPEDEELQIGIRKARNLDAKIALGQKIWVPFEETIGRVEILKAKQLIAQKIRAVEALAIFNAFKEKEGSVVQGVLYKSERAGILVKLQDTLAFLPKSLTIPGEKLNTGYPIKALLKEVLVEPRNDNQLVLDRVSPDFLKKLFEMEIPEVFEGLVEVKKIVRDPGYKSKVMVSSHDPNIDPVGTCIGIGGARIKPILKELSGEKIDVIAAKLTQEDLVKSALKPAEINRVEVIDGTARVWLNDDQRSLAIGKMGKNIALASQLVELSIELAESVQESSKQELVFGVDEDK